MNHLKIKIAKGILTPVLTPVIFTEVLGWKEMKSKQENEIRHYFSSLKMLTHTMEHWEQIISWRKEGVKKKMPDLLIAAISKKSDYPILTRNLNDFKNLNIGVENPWKLL